MRKKKIVILGSTGSIGINTLDVVARHAQRFEVIGLTAYKNFKLLENQVRRFHPRYIGASQQGISYLKRHLSSGKFKFLDVEQELCEIAALPDADVVVIGMSGRAALEPFLAAVENGKTVAPANKEALVMAGEMIMKKAEKHGARIIPIDSEQSAIFQCLLGHNRAELKRVYLTASGGSLRKVPKSLFKTLHVRDILKHPRWKMGKKITVDSATLMNKGFEVIEAQRLFGLDVTEIEVIVHPEAIIHSMVMFRDGSIIGQMGVTDMRLPIQYALSYPDRWDAGLKDLDLAALKYLTFEKPDFRKFPCLGLAFEVAKKGGTLPSVLNAADECAVQAFLDGRLTFDRIFKIVSKIVQNHKPVTNPGLKEIVAADCWAREEASRYAGA